MITQGVEITSSCSECGGLLVRDVGQFIVGGRLCWGIEGSCRACPNGWCEEGGGETPEEIRQALLIAHGPARLRLLDARASLVPVLKALREIWDLPFFQARERAGELMEHGLVGTLVEMEFVASRLRGRQVAVEVQT
ncbi:MULTISPECIES: hypothetical protein [Streptomyces]|uniref:hypothetical protein n=1 Tax=Streptomyces TaxID=1883 RepID=UPI001FD41211|nr:MULTISPECIES: hypothetical protein [Streptomyces]